MTLQSPPNVDLYIIDLYIITKDVTTSTSKTRLHRYLPPPSTIPLSLLLHTMDSVSIMAAEVTREIGEVEVRCNIAIMGEGGGEGERGINRLRNAVGETGR